MGMLIDFPPPGTSLELFLAVLEVLPVATFMPTPVIIGVNKEGDIVGQETPNLHEIPFLRALWHQWTDKTITLVVLFIRFS